MPTKRTAKTRSKKRSVSTSRNVVARDIMTEDPMVIDASATVAEAIEVLASLEIRHLPVMQGNAVVGMLSDRDVNNLSGEAKSETRVSNVMNTNVVSVEPDATLSEIAEVLIENRIGAVAVIGTREDDLVGIVSYVDVLRDVARRAQA